MRTVILLGNRQTKRTIYFEKAARRNGLPFRVLEWEEWRRNGFSLCTAASQEIFLKIDPPLWDNSSLSDLNSLMHVYKEDLRKLESDLSISEFLNPPGHLLSLLDKSACKKILKAAGLPVTETLSGKIFDSASLLSCMEKEQVFQVFLKPMFGSGAAGVTAFRYQQTTGRMAAYSCAVPAPGGIPSSHSADMLLINTKKQRSFTDPSLLLPFLDSLLSLGCIVERWYPKAVFEGYSYDLRAVCQDGNLDFLLARLSKGPITNLHLNNHPLEAFKLGLPPSVLLSIEDLCRKACGLYPGLRSVGIDILLEKNTLKPRIIEMNGQGDLLYQDIYGRNQIYSHQAKMMAQWRNIN